jgi:hypothetical protein
MESQNPGQIKLNFFNGPIADIYRALDGNSIVGAFVLTFCLIDYLTWIEFEDEKQGYNKWIDKRLLNICYRHKAEELYSVRCGLIHTYGPSKKILNQQFMGYHLLSCDPGLHLQRINNNILKICLYSLLTDVVYAAHTMFEEYKPLIPEEQLRRLKQQIGINRTSAPHFYKEMHPALGIFDQYYPVTPDHVRSGYSHYVLWKGSNTP